MTEVEHYSLDLANEMFAKLPDLATACGLLSTAYDVWNEGHLSEFEYIDEVKKVHRWMARTTGMEAPQ